MKRSHIENIRKAVKKIGSYKPTAEQIRTAILKVCPNGEKISENKQKIVAEVINLIQSSSQTQIDEELANVNDISQESESSNDAYVGEETTLTVAQKRELIASQASQLQVTLSPSEIVEVSQSLNNEIESRSSLIAEIKDAIRNFIDTKANYQKQEINNFVSETIDYAATKFGDNDQQLKEGLQEINNFFRSDSAKIKELSKSITTAFR